MRFSPFDFGIASLEGREALPLKSVKRMTLAALLHYLLDPF
jgi:hypothetical protein